MNSLESLISDIKRLGIQENDTVFVRISYKAVGDTEGGPKTVIDALLSVIGNNGTLIATAFPRRILSYQKEKYKESLYVKGMKPTTGAIPVVMSQYPNAFFSSHPISPYVAIGGKAKEITDFHTPHKDSYDVVQYLIQNCNCKCLRVGGRVLDGTTHLAFTEGLKNTNSFQKRLSKGNYYIDDKGEKKWMERNVSAFCYDGFEKFFFEKVYNHPGAVLSEGKIGEGKAMLTDMGVTLAIEREYIAVDPKVLLCESPTCRLCRTSYSYSDQTFFTYTLHQLKYLFKPNSFKKTFARIVATYNELKRGNKCQ